MSELGLGIDIAAARTPMLLTARAAGSPRALEQLRIELPGPGRRAVGGTGLVA